MRAHSDHMVSSLHAVRLSVITVMASRARNKKELETQSKLTRIAIVSSDRCKPKRCRQECKKSCPVVRMGKSQSLCYIFEKTRKHMRLVTNFKFFLP